MKAMFAGSFNPFTKGHYSIVERSLVMFDSVVVAVGCNMAKSTPAAVCERLEAVRRAVASFGARVEVISYSGLTVDAALRCGASCLVRGVRSVADFEYERDMADVNRRISGIETLLMPALPELAAVSSSVVRELRHYGRDVSEFLP